MLAGFLALPFVVFLHVLPFVSDTTLGSDYPRYSVPQQQLLQFSLANGSFPLYLPGFAGGLPAVAATQGQLFHPIAHVAALLPGYWDGRAHDIYTVLNLLSLGFAQWAAYRLLRELALDRTLAFVVSFVTVFNLRMLGLFDYGASLQSWVGTILLGVALGRVVLHGPGYGRFACVAGATYLLLCSGHPQMAYLGFGGAILALGCMAMLVPLLAARRGASSAATPDLRRSMLASVLGLAAGIVLSAACLLPFLLLLLLAWACGAGRVPVRVMGRTFALAPLAIAAMAAVVADAAWAMVSTPGFDALELAPPTRIHEIPQEVVRGVWLLGIASLVTLAVYAQRPSRWAAALLVTLVLAQTTLVLRFGTWLADAKPSTTWHELVRRHRLRVGFGRDDPGAGMTAAILVERRRALGGSGGALPMARLYWDVRRVASRAAAFDVLRERRGGVATLEEVDAGAAASRAEVIPEAAAAAGQGYVRLLHASFNRFVFGTRTTHPALLVFHQPYARAWTASFGDEDRPVEIANGAYLGVAVPAGETVVEMRYDSAAARAGACLSVAAALAIALIGAARLRGRMARVAAGVAVLALALATALGWQRSLYGGSHLGTSFEWKTPDRGAEPGAVPDSAPPRR